MKGWTVERIADLKKYCADKNLSAAQIAERLGGGLSRNAVVGQVYRLGLSLSKSREDIGNRIRCARVQKQGKWNAPVPVKTDAPAARAPLAKPIVPVGPRKHLSEKAAAPRPAAVTESAGEPLWIPFADLKTSQCRFPRGEGDPATFLFCAAPAVEGKPYCAACCVKAYRSEGMKPRALDRLAVYVAEGA